MHLTYTVDYWNHFCKAVLRRDLHHHPSAGGPDEELKHCSWYSETCILYEHTFGVSPPHDIWPPPPSTDVPRNKYTIRPRLSLSHAGFLIASIAFIQACFRNLNPFTLTGPQFLQFYPLFALCCTLLTLWLYSKAGVVLRTQLPDIVSREPYELAYLAGGKKRVLLMLIADGVEHGILRHIGGDDFYTVDGARIHVPGQRQLARISSYDLISSIGLEATADAIARPFQEKYSALRRLFRIPAPIHLPFLITVAIGVARIMQGMANHRPVQYLTIMVIVTGCIFGAIIIANDFHRACTRLFRSDPDVYCSGVTGDLAGLVIFSGWSALVQLPEFRHLKNMFPNNFQYIDGGNSDGGDCNSSCGGSSCGGSGCGGCGGGGD